MPNSPVANAFKTLLGAGAASVAVATVRASIGGVETTLNVARLRALASPGFGGGAGRDAALAETMRALRGLASRLEPSFDPVADGELREGWKRIELATTASNDALRENFLRQARKTLSAANVRLNAERRILARFAIAAIDFWAGRLAVGLETLDATAQTSLDKLERSVGKSCPYRCLQTTLETRDFLAALTERPLLANYWRERAAFFKSWSTTAVPAAERRQATKVGNATRLLETDLRGAALELRKSAFGKSEALNREATAVYERTFGGRPKRRSRVGATFGAIATLCVVAAIGAAFFFAFKGKDDLSDAPATDYALGECVAKVIQDGKPLADAEVRLIAPESERTSASGRADENGEARFTDVAPGRYKVVVEKTVEGKNVVDDKYSSDVTTPLILDVSGGKNEPSTFDVGSAVSPTAEETAEEAVPGALVEEEDEIEFEEELDDAEVSDVADDWGDFDFLDADDSVDSAWNGAPQAGTRKTLEANGVEYAFRYCPAGDFTMGSPEDEIGRFDEEARRNITLTRGFWLLETEVTQEMWESTTGSNPSYFSASGAGAGAVVNIASTAKFPVEQVSWDDCQEFVEKLNASGAAPAGFEFRLPTEAEWEYACRAGTSGPFFWGDALNGDRANCDGNYPCGTSDGGKFWARTTAVGSYAENPWGLFDMHGNVSEYCADWSGKYDATSLVDPTGPTSGKRRVFRGGGWNSVAKGCRAAYRREGDPTERSNEGGVRIALSRKGAASASEPIEEADEIAF